MRLIRLTALALTAAATVTVVAPLSASAAPVATPAVQPAFSKPVSAVITNRTGAVLRIDARSASGDWVVKNLGIDRTAQFDGKAHSGTDLHGWATDDDQATVDFEIYNPVVGRPDVTVGAHRHTFSVGDVWNTGDRGKHVTVERLADNGDGTKVFRMVFKP